MLLYAVGYNVETLSRGRYAEILSTSRGFTGEEDAYFAEGARKAYLSFITKAAASRSVTVDAMNEVAQGRVWTGKQALDRGLVDHIGGLQKAIDIAVQLSGYKASNKAGVSQSIKVETLKEPRSGLGLPFGIGATLAETVFDGAAAASDAAGPLYMCDDSIASTDLVSSSSLGIPPLLKSLGFGPTLSYLVSRSEAGRKLLQVLSSDASTSSFVAMIKAALEK